jgi:hypothetical protein
MFNLPIDTINIIEDALIISLKSIMLVNMILNDPVKDLGEIIGAYAESCLFTKEKLL